MAKKQTETTETSETYTPSSDFSLSGDAKEPALIPNGTYRANVVSVMHDTEKACISWKVALSGNGGYCSDEETAIDGITMIYNNWLPKPGDENEMESSGRQSKRQGKINRMAKFMKAMRLTQDSIAEIDEAIDNAEYVGMEVEVKIQSKIFNDVTSNEIKDMYLA